MTKTPRIAIITQARMTSTRLPGKILKSAGGKTLLEHHLDRLSKAGFEIIIATTTNASDEPIVSLCKSLGYDTFRGDEQDVLSRYFFAAENKKLDVIVRVTSDCPLIDGPLIAESMNLYLAESQHRPHLYLSNCLERTFPRGFDFEIFSFLDLKEAFEKATLSSDREHVTPYLHQNRNHLMNFLSVKNSVDESKYRLTVDEADDFSLIKKLIEEHQCHLKNWSQIVAVLQQYPELQAINSHVEQKKL